jgi:hypothetical protein
MSINSKNLKTQLCRFYLVIIIFFSLITQYLISHLPIYAL